MNFAISYCAEYRYDAPVSEQHNALRVMPASTDVQRVHSFEITLDPQAHLFRHRDYFGTDVIQFNAAGRHERLAIDARARVSTLAPSEPPDGPPAALADRAYRAEGAEYLLGWGVATANHTLDDLVAEVRRPAPLETVHALYQLIPDRFDYRPGATYVGSTVEDLLEGGAGVCQDFVHLGLAMLRRHGIAARYVSGYLFAPGGEGASSAEVDSHAWLEALLPDPDGEPRWVGVDPTNRRLTGPEHVKIGHGREYADVPPIRGVYSGDAAAEHEVMVRMVDLDRAGDSEPPP